MSTMAEVAKSAADGIPIIYLSGGHYEIGQQVGKTFKKVIEEALVTHTTLASKLIPFYNTPRGKKTYDDLLSAAETNVPQYVAEIKGISSGSEAEFYKLFLTHIEADVAAILQEGNDQAIINEGCSDFLVHNNQWTLHVHSEDADPGTRYMGCIWMADIEPSELNGYKAESFISYAYPGMIPGNAWSVNSHGLLTSGNIISQKQIFTPGMTPRRLMGRAAMSEVSIPEFVKTHGNMSAYASAFNYMASQRVCEGTGAECVKTASIEVMGKGESNHVVETPTLTFQHHFNEFQWLPEPCYTDPSSVTREKRLQEFKEEFGGDPSTLDHIKTIMSDVKYKDYPFFRDGAPPDYLATANIAIADRYKDELCVYKLKPSENEPTYRFDIKPWAGSGRSAKSRLINK